MGKQRPPPDLGKRNHYGALGTFDIGVYGLRLYPEEVVPKSPISLIIREDTVNHIKHPSIV